MRYLFSFLLLLSIVIYPQDPNPVPKDFILAEGGTFMMGSEDGESYEKPVHQVKLSDFYICKHEVTQGEWKAIMPDLPGKYRGDDRPVNQVYFEDVLIYCNKLSVKEGRKPCYTVEGKVLLESSGVFDELPVCDFSANGYRLPTEAEWEYAARGGKLSKGFLYSGSNNIEDVAWIEDNADGTVQPVCTKLPNELGIYDMSGNADELIWDKFDSDAYDKGPVENPAYRDGNEDMFRGGCVQYGKGNCPVYRRMYHQGVEYIYVIGFRLVISKR